VQADQGQQGCGGRGGGADEEGLGEAVAEGLQGDLMGRGAGRAGGRLLSAIGPPAWKIAAAGPAWSAGRSAVCSAAARFAPAVLRATVPARFGLNLKASGFLPLAGLPEFVEGDPHHGPALMRWSHDDGSGTAVAINYRIPVPKLRRLSNTAPAAVSSAV
jgi:hypothetical protein